MAKKKVVEVVEEAVSEAVKVHTEFEGEIDPLLLKWFKHPASGWIACGFGTALLTIGGVVGFVLGKLV